MEKAKIELEEKVDKVAADWETLKRLNLEFFEQAEIQFFNTLDLGQATAYADKLAEDARKIEAMKAEMGQYAEPVEDEVPIEEGYEPFDPMTMEQEHRPMQPIPAPSEPMQPIACPTAYACGRFWQRVAADSGNPDYLPRIEAAERPGGPTSLTAADQPARQALRDDY